MAVVIFHGYFSAMVPAVVLFVVGYIVQLLRMGRWASVICATRFLSGLLLVSLFLSVGRSLISKKEQQLA